MSTFIKKCREEAVLTQAQLAEKMDVSVVAVQNWERGKTKINLDRYRDLAAVFNVPVDKLIKEILIEEDMSCPDRWPEFLFDDDTNAIIDTLHLNLVQQDLFGLLYICGAEYLKKTEIDIDTFEDDLKRIPYGFIDRVGSIQFINQAEELHKVIKYVKSDFLMKVLKQNPAAEFNIRKLPKHLICEFIDEGYKPIGDTDSYWDDPKKYEGEGGLCIRTHMSSARIMLTILEKNGAVHITDDWWSNPIRDDIPEEVLSGILEKCGFKRDLWEKGYYKDRYNIKNVLRGLEEVTDYKNISQKGKEEYWIWEINDKGRKLLEWFHTL